MAEDWGLQSEMKVLDRLVRVDGRFVIDAGCGDMTLSRKLAERGARVLAIDPDPVQAKSNREAPTLANVGFDECGAENIPVEPGSVDGVIFSNSLHHVPAQKFEAVFAEVARVLRPCGFLYIKEPVANGSHQDVMELFHDETQVRYQAYQALLKYAHSGFEQMREIYYDIERRYSSFEQFTRHYSHLSYNDGKYEGDRVSTPAVEKRFEQCRDLNGSGYVLEQPMRVNVYSGPR